MARLVFLTRPPPFLALVDVYLLPVFVWLIVVLLLFLIRCHYAGTCACASEFGGFGLT
jgi:hypothetical protein